MFDHVHCLGAILLGQKNWDGNTWCFVSLILPTKMADDIFFKDHGGAGRCRGDMV